MHNDGHERELQNGFEEGEDGCVGSEREPEGEVEGGSVKGTFVRFASLVAWLSVVALAVITAVCILFMASDEPSDDSAVTYSEEYLPGQPLDAVKVNAPTFSGGKYAYKVADRTSGACWWLVKDPDGKWQVYPVCEGYSYVRQQTQEKVAE